VYFSITLHGKTCTVSIIPLYHIFLESITMHRFVKVQIHICIPHNICIFEFFVIILSVVM